MHGPIDLDHNATTPPLPAALDAMRDTPAGNPASPHAAGRAARRALTDALARIAGHLGADPDQVLITAGATESNNLAVFGLAGERPGRVLTSPLEHPCVTEPLKQLAGRGFMVETLPVGPDGVTRLDFPAEPLPRFGTLMLVSHDTGAIQPVAEFAARGFPVHCDAAQAVGKIPVNMAALGVASLAVSAHKFRGPVGVGFLVTRPGLTLPPRAFGGHQQRGRRPGTEPVPLVVAAAVALDHAVTRMHETATRMIDLRTRFLHKLRAALPDVAVNGPPPGDAGSSPATLNVSFPGLRTDRLVAALDLAGVRCSGGAACASGSLLPSPGLTAMGLTDDVLRGAVRFGFGETTTEAGADAAAERVILAVTRMRGA